MLWLKLQFLLEEIKIHLDIKLPYQVSRVRVKKYEKKWSFSFHFISQHAPSRSGQLCASHLNKQSTSSERSQVLIRQRVPACSVAKKMLWEALQMSESIWGMGSDSAVTYRKTCIKISLTACQSTYHLSLWPSICLPIHLSAKVGCFFFFFYLSSHQRCIEIQSLVWTQWVWGELPEQIRTGGSCKEPSSDHSSFFC